MVDGTSKWREVTGTRWKIGTGFPSLCCWEPVGDRWNEEHWRLRNFHGNILEEFLQPQCGGDY